MILNFLVFLAVILTAYLAFTLAEHYEYLVKGMLGLSVIYLLYRILSFPNNNVAATANNIRNPRNLKDFLLLFLLGVIVFIAGQEIASMFMLMKVFLLK